MSTVLTGKTVWWSYFVNVFIHVHNISPGNTRNMKLSTLQPILEQGIQLKIFKFLYDKVSAIVII